MHRNAYVLIAALMCASVVLSVCRDQNLPLNPANPGAVGPHLIGVRNATITTRSLNCEIWYPAAPGSDAGKSPQVWDIRELLPDRYAGYIPDEENPWQICQDPFCYRDLPLDTTFGPYPVMVFIHGTGGWKGQSLHHVTHWASRGFVVIAADHPGIYLKDAMDFKFDLTDQTGDAYKIIAALKEMVEPDLLFLRGFIDMSRLAVSGHSAGGSALRGMGDVANVLIPMGSSGVNERGATALQSVLVLGGVEDGIADYSGQVNGYGTSPIPKRLAGVSKTGHHFCSEMCYLGRDGGGIAQIAIDNGIREALFFRALAEDGCDYYFTGKFLQPEETWPVVNYASSAVLEELLMCDARMTDAVRSITTALPQTFEYREQLAQ
eukprot:TRINITY_DN217_c0_g1_i6.p1 TRINITY_DN217_c0_g1~~TRINITY_DN217_c0_g1_i6.p1  ORF type:complete len:378 (-),score=83.13 TRINITY_DN217_c0_g1_i6:73-1206(-)